MNIKFLTLLILLILKSVVFSQVPGFEGRKMFSEINFGFSYINNISMQGVNVKEKSTFKRYVTPSVSFEGNFNYTVSKSNSIGIIFSKAISQPFDNNFTEVSNLGYGIRFNYFVNNIAPVGGSLSFYLKNNSTISSEHTYDGMVDKLELKFVSFGLSYNLTTFISSKYPMYIKYGMTLGLGVPYKYTRGEEKIRFIDNDTGFGGYAFAPQKYKDFMDFYRFSDVLLVNFGFGYIF